MHQHICAKATADARAYLEKVAARLDDRSSGIAIDSPLSRNVGHAILRQAASEECDLVAISTHGRGGVSRLLLGSVADKIVRGSDAPVLVYHPAC